MKKNNIKTEINNILKKRKTQSNGINLFSSRTHLLINIKIFCGLKESFFTIIDLAGYEKSIKKNFINSSLLNFGSVLIKPQLDFSYRNSILTKICKKYLITSKVCILTTINATKKTKESIKLTLNYVKNFKKSQKLLNENPIFSRKNSKKEFKKDETICIDSLENSEIFFLKKKTSRRTTKIQKNISKNVSFKKNIYKRIHFIKIKSNKKKQKNYLSFKKLLIFVTLVFIFVIICLIYVKLHIYYQKTALRIIMDSIKII